MCCRWREEEREVRREREKEKKGKGRMNHPSLSGSHPREFHGKDPGLERTRRHTLFAISVSELPYSTPLSPHTLKYDSVHNTQT